MNAIDMPTRGDQYSLERVNAFSDGVFAIAGTLLVVNIKVPEALDAEALVLLRQMAPQILAFLISFLVVALYWASHHRLFLLMRRVDSAIMRLNLGLLALICLLPIATAMISSDTPSTGVVEIYAGQVALIGLINAAMWLRVLVSGDLRQPEVTNARIRGGFVSSLLAPLVFLGSILLARHSPDWAMRTWIILAVLVPASRRLARRFGA